MSRFLVVDGVEPLGLLDWGWGYALLALALALAYLWAQRAEAPARLEGQRCKAGE